MTPGARDVRLRCDRQERIADALVGIGGCCTDITPRLGERSISPHTYLISGEKKNVSRKIENSSRFVQTGQFAPILVSEARARTERGELKTE